MTAAPELRRKTMTVQEAAGVLGLGLCKAYQLVRSGELKSMRIGRKILIRPETLEAYMQFLEDGGVDDTPVPKAAEPVRQPAPQKKRQQFSSGIRPVPRGY